MKFHLHVGEIVLDGVPLPPGDIEGLRAAIADSLTERFYAVPDHWSTVSGTDLGRVRCSQPLLISSSGRASDLGRQIGDRIYSSLTDATSPPPGGGPPFP